MTPDEPVLFPALRPSLYGNGRRRERLILPRLLTQAAHDQRLIGPRQNDSHAVLLRWADLESSGKLARMNEAKLRGEFLTDVFGQALGYTLFSENLQEWQLQPEFSVNGGTVDAAIGSFGGNQTSPPRALIELKGPTTNLDSGRTTGRTPVQQLWDYLNAVPGCPWGIVTNYVSFRLYHRNKTPRAYELFTLQDLRRRETFLELYCLLGPGGLLPEVLGQRPRADQLLKDTDERQREIGDKLYEDYSSQRLALIRHLHERMKYPLDTAIRIAQKLLDRVIFVAFCEDRMLLPGKSLERAWSQVPPFTRVTNPRWRNFLDLFRAVDVGQGPLGVEHGYNGGLFREDPEVDGLQLDDQWTQFFKEIGDYDFRDEVNVEVLGHLFEKSVTELEKLHAGGLFGLEPDRGGRAMMPKSAQRKRFGIYYTPPEFTGFLVERTIGEIVRLRIEALAGKHGAEYEQACDYWHGCLAALRDIKVCDPACGSGAFLIRAYDFFEQQYADVIDRLEELGDRQASALSDAIPDMILADNLFGVDLSPEAVEITQLALWIRSARIGKTLADLSQNVICGNSLVSDPQVDPDKALDWAKAFPAVFSRPNSGFDAVIGNPPWERLKLQEREFFSLSAPDIAAAVSAAQRRRMVSELERANPELHARYLEAKRKADVTLAYARACERFPLTGKGDINTYVLFAELARSIVAPSGRVGMLFPSGIATDETTKVFFNRLMDERALILFYDFENKRPFFPDVHRSFKFCTLVFGGSQVQTPEADFVFFAREMEDLQDRDRHIALSAADMVLVNPNTRTCPIFRRRRDAKVTKAVYRRIPILIDQSREAGGNPWGVKFVRMFDQTNDAELFHTREQLEEMGFKPVGNRWRKRKQIFLPLYEAKMVQAYDHRAAGVTVDEENWFRQGQKSETTLVSHQNPEFLAQPRWWVEEAEVLRAMRGRSFPAFLCFKNVTSPTNERTMIAAFIPQSGVGNSAPLILTGEGITYRLQCCLLANLNSFILDYVARQKIGNVNLNFYLIEQFPTPSPDAYAERCPWNERQTLERWISDRVLKLTCTADDMRPLAEAAGFKEGVHKWKPEERARLRAELDAAYFRLYGVERDDVEYILSTFSGRQRRDESDVGSYRTSELILAAYDELTR